MIHAPYDKKIRLYETSVLSYGLNASGNKTDGFQLLSGSRLVFSLNVVRADVGASISIALKNGLSVDTVFATVLTFNLSAVGIIQQVISDIHNLFDYDIIISGGTVDYYFGVSVFDNAMTTRIENAEIKVDLSHVADPTGKFDSVRVGDGAHLLGINPDGSVNVNIIDAQSPVPENVKSFFNEQPLVLANALTIIGSYTVPASKRALLQKVCVSGQNIGEYFLYKNGILIDIQRTMFGENLNAEFSFCGASEEGLPIVSGDLMQVYVLHKRSSSANYNSRIQVVEIG